MNDSKGATRKRTLRRSSDWVEFAECLDPAFIRVTWASGAMDTMSRRRAMQLQHALIEKHGYTERAP